MIFKNHEFIGLRNFSEKLNRREREGQHTLYRTSPRYHSGKLTDMGSDMLDKELICLPGKVVTFSGEGKIHLRREVLETQTQSNPHGRGRSRKMQGCLIQVSVLSISL